QARVRGGGSCPPQQVDPSYAAHVDAALGARQDVWGNDLLRAPGGPTYARVAAFLHPLMLVGPPAGDSPNRLTDSGIYYLAFGRPARKHGFRSIDLHVADGSEIVSEYVKRARLSVDVGVAGYERYGSCLARLAAPRLAGGYLPILRTSYVDAGGVHVQARASVGGWVLELAARGGCEGGGPGPACHERGAEPPDPEPPAHVAVQPRELLRAVLVGDGGRGRGARRVRVHRRRAA